MGSEFPWGTWFSLLALGSWVFGALEMIGGLILFRPVFRIGPIATRSEEVTPMPPGLATPHNGQTEHSRYYVAANGECVFTRRTDYWGVHVSTPLAIKGMVAWSDGAIQVTGRYYLGVLLFLGLWAVGAIAAGIFGAVSGSGLGIVSGLVLLASFVAISVASRRFELDRFRKLAAEVREALQADQSE